MMKETVLSIQSHVVYGHVGNRSAVFPLERLGIEVWPINTVQFSSHTGLPGWKGMRFSGDHIRSIFEGLEAIQVLDTCTAILSGYIGDISVGQAIVDAVCLVKNKNNAALYCCDPVMGDLPDGLYVQGNIPEFFLSKLVPMADILTPNHFEAELLSGMAIQTEADALKAAGILHALGPRIILITSYKVTTEKNVGCFLSDGKNGYVVETPRLPFLKPVKGAGDLMSALFLGNYLRDRNPVSAFESTVNCLWAVLQHSYLNHLEELSLVEAQQLLVDYPKRFSARLLEKP